MYILALFNVKRLFVILILSAFLFSAAGCYVLVEIKRTAFRQEAKEKIKKSIATNQLSLIRINQSEIQLLEWEEENEFFYKGNLYDVVCTKQEGNVTLYYCLKDQKECELIDAYMAQLKKENDPQGQKNKNLKELINLFCSEPISLDLKNSFTKITFQFPTPGISERQTYRNYPPPKTA